jgi:hypothetical protein
MAAITISLSQNMATAIMQQLATSDRDTIADDVQLFFGAGLGFAANHGANNTAANTAEGLVLAYADGATSIISDVAVGADGKATASGFTDTVPGLFSMHLGGSFNYNYNLLGGALSLLNGDADLTSGSFKTNYAASDPNYDPLLGNASVGFQGQVHSAAGSDFSGVITSITAAGEHVLTSGEATGTFYVSGNGLKVGTLQASPNVSGALNSYHEHFDDGSSVTIDNAQIAVAGTSTIDDSLVLNGANFAGDDVFTVTLPATLSTPWAINAGDGDDKIILNGGGSQLSANGGNGNDVIVLRTHGHNVDGGAGIDTVQMSEARSAVTIAATANGYQLTTSSGIDHLTNVERLQFSDGALALDISGNAGQAYRLYQAAFNRSPDQAGLSYWIGTLDHGASLKDVADAFSKSAEFASLYGSNPTNADLVNSFYQNVLHRPGDAGGYAYWLDILNRHAATPAEVLTSFSESPENQAALAPVIGAGITYTPWG